MVTDKMVYGQRDELFQSVGVTTKHEVLVSSGRCSI